MAEELANKAKGSTALAVSDYGEDLGHGFDQQTAADRTIPFLALLQDGSPQVKEKGGDYVKGAKPGFMMNTVTKEIYDGDVGVIVFPVTSEHCYCEWTPKDKGGGFHGKHAVNSPIVEQARKVSKDQLKLFTPDGNHQLVETFYYYALLKPIKGDIKTAKTVADLVDLSTIGTPVVIPFSSTKIKPYKQANTTIGMFTLPGLPFPNNQPPLWTFPLHFTTAFEQREAGDSFNYRINFALGQQITQDRLLPRFFPGTKDEVPLYAAAREFRKAVLGNLVKVDYSQQAAGGGSSGNKSGGDEVPF